MSEYEIQQKVGEVVTAVEGHLSRMAHDEKLEFLDQLDDRLIEIQDDVDDAIEDLEDFADEDDP